MLERLSLPTDIGFDKAALAEAIGHDKKLAGNTITVVYVPKIGKFEFRKITLDDYIKMLSEVL